MDSEEFKKKLLENRKARIVEIVNTVCNKERLPKPKVNFDGCSLETENQLGHYHPDLNKICISEIQLYKLKEMSSIEDTVFHELAHILEVEHGGRFDQVKNRFKHDAWRPPKGVIYLSGDIVREANERIRGDSKRLASVNEDSDYVKAMEGRPTRSEEIKKYDSEVPNKAPTLSKQRKTQKSITKRRKQSSRHRAEEKKAKTNEANMMPSKNPLSDKEQEQLTNKAYEGYDTSFGGKKHPSPTRKAGWLRRIKDALGIS